MLSRDNILLSCLERYRISLTQTGLTTHERAFYRGRFFNLYEHLDKRKMHISPEDRELYAALKRVDDAVKGS